MSARDYSARMLTLRGERDRVGIDPDLWDQLRSDVRRLPSLAPAAPRYTSNIRKALRAFKACRYPACATRDGSETQRAL